jgi:hypothetical protein
MNPKFEVKFETKYCLDDYDYQQLILLDIVPKCLVLNCPHCEVYSVMRLDSVIKRFKADEFSIAFCNDENFLFDLICSCPNCHSTIFVQAQAKVKVVCKEGLEELEESSRGEVIAIYPYRKSVFIPPEIPEKYANDFRESLLVLDLSPMASSALSRRILQNILRDEFNIQCRTLADEINSFIALPSIPSYLVGAVDAIRNIGNFAAHPLKNTNTGEIVTVEPGEAEWLIEVLDSLFDFQFIQPKKLQERRKQLNAKLQDLGKPPMK